MTNAESLDELLPDMYPFPRRIRFLFEAYQEAQTEDHGFKLDKPRFPLGDVNSTTRDATSAAACLSLQSKHNDISHLCHASACSFWASGESVIAMRVV